MLVAMHNVHVRPADCPDGGEEAEAQRRSVGRLAEQFHTLCLFQPAEERQVSVDAEKPVQSIPALFSCAAMFTSCSSGLHETRGAKGPLWSTHWSSSTLIPAYRSRTRRISSLQMLSVLHTGSGWLRLRRTPQPSVTRLACCSCSSSCIRSLLILSAAT